MARYSLDLDTEVVLSADRPLSDVRAIFDADPGPRVLVLKPRQALLADVAQWGWDEVVTEAAPRDAAPEVTVAQAAPPDPAETARNLIFCATWQTPADTARLLEKEIAAAPKSEARFREAVARGLAAAPHWRAFKHAIARGQDPSVARAAFLKVAPELRWRLDRHQKKSAALRQRPPILPTALRPSAVAHALHLQAPARSWTFLVDETGNQFSAAEEGPTGRIVLLAVPEGVKLPELRGFHGTALGVNETEPHLQVVLDAPMGVLGLTVDPELLADSLDWSTVVQSLLGLALRILPRSGPTRVQALVEARGDRATGWAPVGQAILRALRREDPEFADLDFAVQTVSKQHPLVPYADVVAYTWGSPAMRERLAITGLAGSCLHADSRTEARGLFERLSWSAAFDPAAWSDLLRACDTSDHPFGGLLARTDRRLAHDADAWHAALRYAEAHLDGDRMDVYRARRELEALERTRNGRPLSRRMALALATARLAVGNHLGDVDITGLTAVRELAFAHADEDVRASVLAALHLAVRHTNRFDFDAAKQEITPWLTQDLRAVGARLAGRLQSTRGQHLAFSAELAEARVAFADAWQAFQRLSDPEDRRRECGQTDTYQMICVIDDASIDDATVQHRVRRWFGAPEGSAVEGAAISREIAGDAEAPYRHHVWVRYLALRGAPAEREAYLAASSHWAHALSHPWPLIDAWRAVLFGNTEGAVAYLSERLDAAEPTVGTRLYIYAALRAACAAAGGEWPDREAELAALRASFPVARVAALSAAADRRAPIAVTLITLLPFNFR